MQFYTVHYTTKEIVTRYDKRGKAIEELVVDHPQILTCLPHTTAMQFKDQDNFRFEQYRLDEPRTARRDRRPLTTFSKKALPAPRVTRTPRPSAVQSAAATGDLAAAIGGGG